MVELLGWIICFLPSNSCMYALFLFVSILDVSGCVRRVLALLLVLLARSAVHAQAPTWQTAVAASGNTSIVNATAVDASGNVYVAGEFTGTVSFGNVSLVGAGDVDVFVVKFVDADSTS